jgi:cell pole-organizing protein PopZ
MSAPLRPIVAQPAPAPEAPEPLALSAEQILADDDQDDSGAATALSFQDILAGNDSPDEYPASFAGEPELVDPEDIAFDADDESESYEAEADEPLGFSVALEEPAYTPPPVAVRQPAPTPRPMPPPLQAALQQPTPRPAASVAQAAPMPDPTLSTEMAERLLEPTTQSAVKHAFARLSGLSMVGTGVTIEDMMREMLRPMLKEWLDENLPSIVESMVEKEIARISRGVE